ncbi:GM13501 [Drosophila sechellia]|uniref:GM13501 n=1 Tax=Drosophila sechellia TaxID=7238 RepID=B4IEZ8_DROSE|nr:GM13501 [Drosophila sechellia]
MVPDTVALKGLSEPHVAMRDLKQRLFDLLRSGGNNNSSSNNNSGSNGSNSNTNNSCNSHQNKSNNQTHATPAQKPKKLHEYTAADCNAAFLRKYHDLSISRDREMDRERDRERERAGPGQVQSPNVIYFNENLSMASKYNVRPFPLARYPSCPLSSFGLSPGSGRPEGSAGSSLGEEEDTESEPYHFCSDEDHSSHTQTIKLRRHQNGHHGHHGLDLMEPSVNEDADLEDEQAESQLDSFCTLCTSTFSYNKCCRFCENSLCGSKCNSERGSHASRMSRISQISRNLDGGYPPDPDLDSHQLQPHRFGGSMRMLAHHQSAAIRVRILNLKLKWKPGDKVNTS